MVCTNKISKLLAGFFKIALQGDNIKTGLGLYNPFLSAKAISGSSQSLWKGSAVPSGKSF
jgi:hypothetical protein